MNPPSIAVALALAVLACLPGCRRQNMALGEGGSVATGSAGPEGAHGAAPQLRTCKSPVAVVSLAENQNGYVGIGMNGLPNTPLPLVRVLMQQSGCFRVVDRNAGLNATMREQELKRGGVLRQDDTTVQAGRGIVSQYTVVPSLTFSERDAGREIGGVVAQIPGVGGYAGVLDNVKLKEAQTVLLLTDNETTEQLVSATGAARSTDLGIGGILLGGKVGGLGGMGWSNTNEGKVIVASFLDAHNHLVEEVERLVAKPLPAPVPVRRSRD